MSVRTKTMNDFIGFQYGDKHSSELGIVRVSDGSRFNENLLPTIKDKTVQVPGGDGTYYFGSEFTQRQFTINYAFDDLTEAEFRALKQHFGKKEVRLLTFDERPDRTYSAKVTGTASIKHIPFDGKDGEVIYKGEGSIQFTCYYPFARATSSPTDGVNSGDIPVPFILVLDPEAALRQIDLGTINWEKLTEKAQLDTRTGLVFKLDEDGNPTKTLMNKYVTGDLTVKIPVGAKAPTGAVFYCEYI